MAVKPAEALKARNGQQVARAGEHLVAGELHRRGAYAVTFAGNMPAIDVVASNLDQSRTVFIQVKTKQTGSWQTSTKYALAGEGVPDEDRFWIFVDLKKPGVEPLYYVCPESWIRNNIDEVHKAYLAKHGGERAQTPGSTHHAIRRNRLDEWHDRWDLLGIF